MSDVREIRVRRAVARARARENLSCMYIEAYGTSIRPITRGTRHGVVGGGFGGAFASSPAHVT